MATYQRPQFYEFTSPPPGAGEHAWRSYYDMVRNREQWGTSDFLNREAAEQARESAEQHEMDLWEKYKYPLAQAELRVKEKAIDVGAESSRYGHDTQRYGYDVGAETSRYGTDVRAGTARGQLDYQNRFLDMQKEQADIGNYFHDQKMRMTYGDAWKSPEGGWSYEDLGGQGDDGYWSGGSYIPDGWSGGVEDGDYFDYGLTAGGDGWYSGMEDYDIEYGWD